MAPQFSYSDLLPIGEDKTKYRNIGKVGVSVIQLGDREFLQVDVDDVAVLHHRDRDARHGVARHPVRERVALGLATVDGRRHHQQRGDEGAADASG